MPYRKTKARQDHAEAVRIALLDAAVAVVREHGADGLTVRRVVAAANSSIGNYYHHFADKESLLVALVDQLADRTAAEIDAAAASVVQVPERLRIMVTTGVTAALRDPALARLLFASQYGEEVRERVRARFVRRTASFFAAMPVGAAASVDPALVAVLWQGAILGLLEQLATGELAVPVEKAAEICAQWNLRALGIETLEAAADPPSLPKRGE